MYVQGCLAVDLVFDRTVRLRMSDQLALCGGIPVWRGEWPAWPQVGLRTSSRLEGVLVSGRWAVSGSWTGEPALDRELSYRFADFTGARWCVPVDHGSSALLAALIALDVRPGDEIIVPGLTWVACASAVARMGAIPILVDIDAETQCMDPQAVSNAITSSTVAILVVHLYSAMANMDAIQAIAKRYGLAIIEDAAQAYGAKWNGAVAGSLGDVGCFSTQQGKALTSGEGGLVVTSKEDLRDRIEMLRGDGRRYSSGPFIIGEPELEEQTTVQGWNMHLSEFQAALLLDGLERLEKQNKIRTAMASRLDETLPRESDLEPIRPYPSNDQRSYYHYVIRMSKDAFAGRSVTTVCRALTAELGTWIHPTYPPLNQHPLLDPRRLPTRRESAEKENDKYDLTRFDLPVAFREAQRSILFHHSMLLGDERHITAICDAFDKVRRCANQLPAEPS